MTTTTAALFGTLPIALDIGPVVRICVNLSASRRLDRFASVAPVHYTAAYPHGPLQQLRNQYLRDKRDDPNRNLVRTTPKTACRSFDLLAAEVTYNELPARLKAH